MRILFPLVLAVFALGIFATPGSAQAADYCTRYGTPIGVNNPYNGGCPSSAPERVDGTLLPEGYAYCCMTAERKAEYLAANGGGFGGPAPTGTSQPTTPRTGGGTPTAQTLPPASSVTTAASCAAAPLQGVCALAEDGCPGSRSVYGSCGAERGNCCVLNSVLGSNSGGSGTPTSGLAPQFTTVSLENPLAFDTVEEGLASIMTALRNIVVVLALLMLVIGGIMYILSAGNQGMATKAKATITAALIGLAIVMAAPSFLKEIGAILGWGEVNQAEGVAAALTLTQIARNVLNFLLSIIGILAIIMLVIGGITYLGAAGDQTRAQTGKKIVTYAIIGITVAFASLVLVTQVARFFE